MLENRFNFSWRMSFSEHLCHSGFKTIIPIRSQPIHARPHRPCIGVILVTENWREQRAFCPKIVRLSLRTLCKHPDQCLCSVLPSISMNDPFCKIFAESAHLGRLQPLGYRSRQLCHWHVEIPEIVPVRLSRQPRHLRLPLAFHTSSSQHKAHHTPSPPTPSKAKSPASQGNTQYPMLEKISVKRISVSSSSALKTTTFSGGCR